MSKQEPARKRKPAARRSDVIIACIQERIGMLPVTPESEDHLTRLSDLFDELSRSLNKNTPESGEEG